MSWTHHQAGAKGTLDTHHDLDKGHSRIERRCVSMVHEVDWLDGSRRFLGETRLPGVAGLMRVSSRTELKDRCRFDTRFYVSSAHLTARRAAEAVTPPGDRKQSALGSRRRLRR